MDVPVTVDAEAGYGLDPRELVAALKRVGASGCNLEDTNHSTGGLKDSSEHASWLRAVREAATAEDYPLVINARIDVFLLEAGGVPEALERAGAYFDAGADCVYPITLSGRAAVAEFVSAAGGPVNVIAGSDTPSVHELAELGVARVSYGSALFRRTMKELEADLRSLG
jgi:2-methylisocitrate lyase-like PEP mutase family enzyme